LGGVDNHVSHDYAFREACRYGHLETAQWLLFLGGVDVHIFEDDAFRTACWYGHLEIAKWLHALGGVGVHVRNDEAFRLACEGGHLETARWLYSLGGVDIDAHNECAFLWACNYYRLEIAQWLASAGAHLHSVKTEAFILACKNDRMKPYMTTAPCKGRTKMVKWLVSLGALDVDVDVDVTNALSELPLKTLKWLATDYLSCLPPECLSKVKTWSVAKDGWIKAVVGITDR
jgi:hypothetical protein